MTRRKTKRLSLAVVRFFTGDHHSSPDPGITEDVGPKRSTTTTMTTRRHSRSRDRGRRRLGVHRRRSRPVLYSRGCGRTDPLGRALLSEDGHQNQKRYGRRVKGCTAVSPPVVRVRVYAFLAYGLSLPSARACGETRERASERVSQIERVSVRLCVCVRKRESERVCV